MSELQAQYGCMGCMGRRYLHILLLLRYPQWPPRAWMPTARQPKTFPCWRPSSYLGGAAGCLGKSTQTRPVSHQQILLSGLKRTLRI